MASAISSGEISQDAPVRQRSASIRPAGVNSADESQGEAGQTINATAQPAAIVSKNLARMRGGESRISLGATDGRTDTSGIQASADLVPNAAVKGDQLTFAARIDTQAVLENLKLQFQVGAEVAVLAQANQLPNGAMPFSVSSSN